VVDGPVNWTSSDTTIVEVVADATDSTDAIVQAKGLVGQAQVSAVGDADLGTGVRSIVTLMDVSVVAGEAVAGTISPVGDQIPPSVQPIR
jgi:hypothetical protein